MITFEQIPQQVNLINERLTRIEGLLNNQKQPSENHNFTLEEAAQYCKLPVPTFRLHLQKRNVTGSKPGKTWIFSQSDLDDFIKRFRVKDVNASDYVVNHRRG
jgi:excisionase family DNA binding protein